MEAKALSYLSLARKAGLAELGEEPVGDMARTGKAYLIAVAADASDHTWRRAKSFAAGTEQQCVRLPFTKEDMGIAVGRTSLAIAAVTDVLAAHGVNICNFRLARQDKGGEAVMTFEMDGSFDSALNREVEALPNILSSTMLQPIGGGNRT